MILYASSDISFLYFLNKCRNIDRYRTSFDTFCIFTIQASCCLFHCLFLIISKTNFFKICCTYFGSCSLTGTLTIPFAITRHLHNVRIRRDEYRLPVISALLFPLLICTSGFSSSPDQNLQDGHQIPARLHIANLISSPT